MLFTHHFLPSTKEQQSLLCGHKRPRCSVSPLAAFKHNRNRSAWRSSGSSTFARRARGRELQSRDTIRGATSCSRTCDGGRLQLFEKKKADSAQKQVAQRKRRRGEGFFRQNTCLRVTGETPHVPEAVLRLPERMKNADIAAKQWPPECDCTYVRWLF